MLATDRTGLVLPTLFAVIMHEMGHLFAMWASDCTPKRIKLIPASIQITSPMTKRYRNDIIIAVCGPAVNLMLFLVLYFNYLAFKNEIILYYSILNLIIFMFNALPVCGLDGGTILRIALSKYIGINKASIVLKITTFLTALLIIIAAVLLTLRHKFNISLYIIGFYLFIMTILNK